MPGTFPNIFFLLKIYYYQFVTEQGLMLLLSKNIFIYSIMGGNYWKNYSKAFQHCIQETLNLLMGESVCYTKVTNDKKEEEKRRRKKHLSYVICPLAPITCYLSPTATATEPLLANSPTMHSAPDRVAQCYAPRHPVSRSI